MSSSNLDTNNFSARAEPLLQHCINKAITIFSDRIISIFKFGSLGSRGDFSLCSDVDIALMLDAVNPTDYEIIQLLTDEIKSSAFEYADRLSIFWSSYHPETFATGIGRFPALDRLDFIRNGLLLKGSDQRYELFEPKHADLILESAKFISSFMLVGNKFEKLTKCPEYIAAEGARYFAKFVLFPVRLIFTLDKPGTIGTNKDAVMHYHDTWSFIVPEAKEIIDMAYQLRSQPPKTPVKIDKYLLQHVLFKLYDYCLSRYYNAMLEINNEQVAQQLADGKIRLQEI